MFSAKRHRDTAWRGGVCLALSGLLSILPMRNALAIEALPSFETVSFASTGVATPPPIGWVQFCRDYAQDKRNPCRVSRLPAVDVVLDGTSWHRLVSINQAVNAEIEPITDLEHWGVIDRWSFPDDGKGDCEEYVIEKRHRLMKAGFPRQALLITVVRDKLGDGHAVLTVKTDQGDFVLDNQVDGVLPWASTGYQFIKRQSQEDPNQWVVLPGSAIAAHPMRVSAAR